MKRHPVGTMIGGALLAAWIPFWTFLSGLGTIDFMRTSGSRPSIGTFYLPPAISAGLTVVGIAVMVYAFVLLSERTIVQPSEARIAPTESVHLPESATPQMVFVPLPDTPDVFRDTVMLPDGRSISSCSLENLIAIHKANTTDGASRLLVNRWIKFSGVVDDVDTDGYVSLAPLDRLKPLPIIVLKFAKGWEQQLSALQRGSNVTVRGQVVRTRDNHIRFENCELL